MPCFNLATSKCEHGHHWSHKRQQRKWTTFQPLKYMMVFTRWYVISRALSACLTTYCMSSLFPGKHECDSETGFCPDKCPYNNGSYPYWRIRNAVDVPFLWVISGIKFYDTATSTKQLNSDPKRGYASSYFGPGKCDRLHHPWENFAQRWNSSQWIHRSNLIMNRVSEFII